MFNRKPGPVHFKTTSLPQAAGDDNIEPTMYSLDELKQPADDLVLWTPAKAMNVKAGKDKQHFHQKESIRQQEQSKDSNLLLARTKLSELGHSRHRINKMLGPKPNLRVKPKALKQLAEANKSMQARVNERKNNTLNEVLGTQEQTIKRPPAKNPTIAGKSFFTAQERILLQPIESSLFSKSLRDIYQKLDSNFKSLRFKGEKAVFGVASNCIKRLKNIDLRTLDDKQKKEFRSFHTHVEWLIESQISQAKTDDLNQEKFKSSWLYSMGALTAT